MTPATEFYLDAYLLMNALVALLFALVGVQRLAWWLADRPRRRVGDDLGVAEYEAAAADECTCDIFDIGPRCDHCVAACVASGHPDSAHPTNGQNCYCGVPQ